jgi:hypothetical protein
MVRGARAPTLSVRFPRTRIAALLLAVASAGFQTASAQSAASLEYQVKAAFLFNLGQFVNWQSEVCPDTTSSFVIGVLGEDPFGEILDAVVRGERIQDRPAVVERYDEVEEVGRCQILFIGSSESERLEEIFEGLAGDNVLTVGEAAAFAERDGVIRLAIVNNRLRLEVNTGAARASNLSISSRLLRLADVVRSEGP